MSEFLKHIRDKTSHPVLKRKDSGGLFFQPKLTINNPNDKYEQEADSMADKVMRMKSDNNESSFFRYSGTNLQRQCKDCEEEENLHRKEKSGDRFNSESQHEYYKEVINSGGNSLSDNERNFFEPRFGYDFSKVKIHTDTIAAKSEESVNALAYTSGNNIVFNSNQYSPQTDSGKKLLAHELTHVIQQKGNQQNGFNISRKPNECEPDRDLTWADYKGSVPSGVNWAAMTRSGPKEVDDNGASVFQGYFDPDNSWAQPKYIQASDNSKNGCDKTIKMCEDYMEKHEGKSTDINPVSSGECPASIKHDKVTVKNKGECKSKFAPECKRAAIADSKMLLIHEALHFKISCEMAKKGNIELAKGKSFKDTFEKVKILYKKINLDNGSGQGDYDEESKHRCDQEKQNQWNDKVKKGLPGVVLFEDKKTDKK